MAAAAWRPRGMACSFRRTPVRRRPNAMPLSPALLFIDTGNLAQPAIGRWRFPARAADGARKALPVKGLIPLEFDDRAERHGASPQARWVSGTSLRAALPPRPARSPPRGRRREPAAGSGASIAVGPNEGARRTSLGLSAHSPDIEAAAMPATNEHLADYGLAIARFGNLDVNLDDDNARLKKLADDIAATKSARPPPARSCSAARSPASRRHPAITTAPPSETTRPATARPIPLAPSVTITTFDGERPSHEPSLPQLATAPRPGAAAAAGSCRRTRATGSRPAPPPGRPPAPAPARRPPPAGPGARPPGRASR